MYSVIIPTYNRAGQLQLTLTAFELQRFPRDQFEVIVVDDCSTDHTSDIIKEFSGRFSLQYILTEERSGQGVARNLGAKHANGDILIFCDADLLVVPNFLSSFHQLYELSGDDIISGTPYCFKSVYTYHFSDFSSYEREAFRNVVRTSRFWNKRRLFFRKEAPVITPDDLREDFKCINSLKPPWEIVPDDMKMLFENTNVAPWLLFITRCISLRKSVFLKEGGFDDRLIRGEDWEFGYRLYKKGYTFKSVGRTIGYHQEHPTGRRNPHFHHPPFYVFLYEKFGIDDLELALLSLWDSSDDLWSHIPLYKKILTDLVENRELSVEHKLLLKASERLAEQRLAEFRREGN